MGLYDRDYYRDPPPSQGFRLPQSAVGTLVLVNVAVYLIGELLVGTGQIMRLFAATPETPMKPWLWWQFITYGFVHSPEPMHVLSNMLGLWFFGRDVEFRYGKAEFLRLYFVFLTAGSVVWTLLHQMDPAGAMPVLIGASGAVTGIVILYAVNFPHTTVLLFFVLPAPAWALGVMLVAFDLYGALNRVGTDNVAYSVHLVGAGMAGLYVSLGWNFTRLRDRVVNAIFRRRRAPPPQIWQPPGADKESPSQDPSDQELAAEVDKILEKIHKQGESSLTPRERATLESASREYQRRRRDHS